ncbi:hypothetical protein BGZ83_000642 [Gryganskiella cystojenkinii]|nr:hypothetical protein BGZ83_000642 [Gryganskiella cystojenkinii]
MKFSIAAVTILFLASMVSAQDNAAACTACLQKALQALPACAGVPVSAGSVSPAYAACLCSSLSGSWIDSCNGGANCGSTVSAFKASYASNMQAAGLNCAGGKASFTPLK